MSRADDYLDIVDAETTHLVLLLTLSSLVLSSSVDLSCGDEGLVLTEGTSFIVRSEKYHSKLDNLPIMVNPLRTSKF